MIRQANDLTIPVSKNIPKSAVIIANSAW